jgi:hypothetical protein
MPFNQYRTKRPHEALLDLYIDKKMNIVECRRESQDNDGTPPLFIFESNRFRVEPRMGQCMVASLPGAGTCKKVTRVHKGQLGPAGNRTVSAKA